jgi:hypothetical protein
VIDATVGRVVRVPSEASRITVCISFAYPGNSSGMHPKYPNTADANGVFVDCLYAVNPILHCGVHRAVMSKNNSAVVAGVVT